ncbi:hypothetical protein HJG60_009558 [Phyllostomus discolor]|uniref:Uncharacterized protein n=1 Tax=Phyllostomus discolor TaxID=89673 RepID=A0A833YCG9_9CHIR|nr:hypothetical protein HJG60_009558 [Phyllostomus discolor]
MVCTTQTHTHTCARAKTRTHTHSSENRDVVLPAHQLHHLPIRLNIFSLSQEMKGHDSDPSPAPLLRPPASCDHLSNLNFNPVSSLAPLPCPSHMPKTPYSKRTFFPNHRSFPRLPFTLPPSFTLEGDTHRLRPPPSAAPPALPCAAAFATAPTEWLSRALGVSVSSTFSPGPATHFLWVTPFSPG